jgi:hypothetical protein
MLIKDALKITDSFTKTSKMPGLSYSLPAWECQTGAKLRKVPTSPCFGCYALKGNYTRYPAIKAAQYRRLDAIKNPLWVEAMAAKIKNQKWFRWHDAGDVQSHEHMAKILEVVKLTPNTKHWMPTQERPYLPAPEAVPDNMVIRLSGSKVDGPAPKAWSHTSTVVTTGSPSCPAPNAGRQVYDMPGLLEQRHFKYIIRKTLVDFFKNGSGWCQRHGRRDKDPEPIRKSHSPILRKLQAASAKLQAPSSSSAKRQASSPK